MAIAMAMASSLNRCLRILSSSASSHSRFFNSNAFRFSSISVLRNFDFDIEGKSTLPSPSLKVFHIRDVDAFDNIRNRLPKESTVDDTYDEPPFVKGRRLRNCSARETANGLHLRLIMDNPNGLDVMVEKNVSPLGGGEDRLIIENLSWDKDEDREYVVERLSFDLHKRLYQTDAIEAKFRNGGLEVFVPGVHVHVEARKTCAFSSWSTQVVHFNVEKEEEEWRVDEFGFPVFSSF